MRKEIWSDSAMVQASAALNPWPRRAPTWRKRLSELVEELGGEACWGSARGQSPAPRADAPAWWRRIHQHPKRVPEEVMFAAKPELAGDLSAAHERGIRAAFAAGDEVYSGRQLRRAIRALGMGYVLAVRR